jgi:hypothetical protein
MRGRKPRRLTLSPADVPILHGVAHSRRLAWFQVQHARIVLGVASGECIAALAARLECNPATVWRVCRRYERGGLRALLLDDPRLGRPQVFSPLAARSDRGVGLPGAGRRRTPHHPLDQPGSGSPGGRRRSGRRHQSPHREASLARCGFAAASHALLENHTARCPVQGAGRESTLVLRPGRAFGPPGHLGRRGRRGPELPGAGAEPDSAGSAGLHRATGVRVHAARDR